MPDGTTEAAVYSVYLDVDPEAPNATTIADALEAAGLDVHSVKRLDVLGVDALEGDDA